MRMPLLISTILTLLTMFIVVSGDVKAASVSLISPAESIAKNQSISVGLYLETGEDAISGTDVYITYDNKALSYEGFKDLGYFSYVHAIQEDENTIHVSAVVSDAKELKKRDGPFASVSFKALRSGKTYISISCTAGEKGSSKIIRGDLDATDVIDCTNMKSLILSVTDTNLFQKAYTFLFGWLR